MDDEGRGRAKTRLTLLPSLVGTDAGCYIDTSGKRRMTGRRGKRTIARDLDKLGSPEDSAKPSRPPILVTARKLRSKAVLPPLAWAAGWARKPDKPEPGSTS